MMSLSGCSSIYYLYQAGRGQLKIINQARPVDDVIADPTTSPDLAELLKRIPEIKAYGEASGLKPTKNYREYTQLDQDAATYVVTVSDALQFKAKLFKFPVVGSFNYIGWFSLDDARKFTAQFEKEGYDVDVRGASAYSTLGWFKDPLLSTMISKTNGRVNPEAFPELVNVFLHESVHATIYISNQSSFNESLASFVAEKLTEKFFKDSHQESSKGYLDYLANQERYEKIRARFNQLYQELKAMYQANLSDEEKRSQKEKLIGAVQKEFGFKRKISNATLIQFETYHSSAEDFVKLFEHCGRDVKKFMERLAKLKENDFDHPQEENFKAALEKI